MFIPHYTRWYVQSDGACVGMYSKRCCNHWVSEEALKEYISHQVSETLNPATVPCPQCLAERCEKCASHGQQTANEVKVCCVPERQVRSFLSQELTLRCEADHSTMCCSSVLYCCRTCLLCGHRSVPGAITHCWLQTLSLFVCNKARPSSSRGPCLLARHP